MDYFLLELIQQFISMCITVNETIRTPKQLTAIKTHSTYARLLVLPKQKQDTDQHKRFQ